jgi:hypothetical protein
VLELATESSPVYPQDKAEGIALLSLTLLAVSNGYDFCFTGAGAYVAKILPATTMIDRNRVYFITLKKAAK